MCIYIYIYIYIYYVKTNFMETYGKETHCNFVARQIC